MNENPYAAPADISLDPRTDESTAHAEAIRLRHVKMEGGIKAIGEFYMLLGVVIFIIGLAGIFAMLLGFFFAIFLLPFGVLMFFGGLGVRRLNRTWLVVVGLISTLGLLIFPIGTIVNGVILAILFSRKSCYLFSDEYKEIIACSGSVKPKSTLYLIMFVGFIGLLIAARAYMPVDH